MADWNKVESQIEKLISNANEKMSSNKTNITDVIENLIGGYGQGEGEDLSNIVELLGDGEVVEGSGLGGSTGGNTSLNIHYGDTAPEDTSMLWCKCKTPSKVVISPKIGQITNTLSTVAGLNYYAQTRCAVVEDICYIFAPSSQMYMYNLKTCVLSKLDIEVPTSNFHACGVVTIGTKIYIFGGSSLGVYVFDTNKTEFTMLDTPLTTSCASAVLVGSKVYLTGIYNSYNIGVFDIETNAITILSSVLPKYCSGAQSVVVGTKIYIFGGYQYSSSTYSNYNHIIEFDTETNTAKVVSSMPFSGSQAACIAYGSKIYAFGGTGQGRQWNSYYSTIQVYDVETNTNTTLDLTLPIASGDAAVCMYGTDIYVIGGANGSYVSSNIYKFSLQTEVERGMLHIVPDINSNIIPVLIGNPCIELGISRILLGNSDGIAEQVEVYLYKDNEWTQI